MEKDDFGAFPGAVLFTIIKTEKHQTGCDAFEVNR